MYAAHPHHRDVIALERASGKQSVSPLRVRVTQSIAVKPDAVPAGETLRAWLPFPRVISGQQENLQLLSSVPAGARIAPESTLQRTAYLEPRAEAGKKTEFSVTYELTVFARYVAIDPDKVIPAKITPELAEFVAERAPHVTFTDAMRRYSREIVGAEKNPYRIAQRLFAAVDAKTWAVAREYSTLSYISDHALHSEHADCGQQTLLLIALLRMNGIPRVGNPVGKSLPVNTTTCMTGSAVAGALRLGADGCDPRPLARR